ncbi:MULTISPECIES: flagellar basal body P-ring formation chaperone FlgA [Mangrovibacter]|uniref:Flagella basal body P-ring formation protein FlgA n=1 Tax=Mangrovibacter plantisponsor TaxID=451513 RepID=A0A317Q4M5_9ENTR|nr:MULTISPECIES: flagellar basal body P-ring formation chaperone FlgA [Mangrovibacter]KEA52658.1 flagellar basal body P-ring biosynthesis protein FlgA [Mangrovibacter sp. MFB070]PWW09996.1 flagella basal body P-ring formation protein FlgA [Mangrovibacter plantisponsor]
MFSRILSTVAVLVAALPLTCLAGELDSQMDAFFQQRLAGVSDDVKVKINSPQAQLPQCANPEFRLPATGRFWGNLSVMMRCGSQQRYVLVSVQASGNYVVASQVLERGAPVTPGDVELKYGRLDLLPPNTLFSVDDALNAVTLRNIAAGQPIMRTMLRVQWRVKAGQKVQVIAAGQGFSVNSEGKALNNAAVTQNARVRMSSGQVVSGTVDSDGNILINL